MSGVNKGPEYHHRPHDVIPGAADRTNGVDLALQHPATMASTRLGIPGSVGQGQQRDDDFCRCRANPRHEDAG